MNQISILSFLGIDIWAIAKFFVIVFLGIYLAFAIVIVRQVMLMINTVKVDFEGFVKFLAYAHLLFSVAVFIFALLRL